MFDVGFWELVLIFGLGLMILGPERLPRVAAQFGRWINKARRTAIHLRRQLERELELDELINPRSRPRSRPPTPPPGAQRKPDGSFPEEQLQSAEPVGRDSAEQPSAEAVEPAREKDETEQAEQKATGS